MESAVSSIAGIPRTGRLDPAEYERPQVAVRSRDPALSAVVAASDQVLRFDLGGLPCAPAFPPRWASRCLDARAASCVCRHLPSPAALQSDSAPSGSWKATRKA